MNVESKQNLRLWPTDVAPQKVRFMALDKVLALFPCVVVVVDSIYAWSSSLVGVPRLRRGPKVPVNPATLFSLSPGGVSRYLR